MESTPSPTEEHKPCACSGAKPGSSRRDFLLMFGMGLNAIAGAMITIPIVGYVMAVFVKKYPLLWISLGPISNFPAGTTRLASYKNPYHTSWDGPTIDIPCWVRNIDNTKFQVFAINCTHLGCPVRWFQESKLFMCPCHGGAFYEDGGHAAGPPPRGLYEYPYMVDAKTNELMVQGGVQPNLSNPIA